MIDISGIASEVQQQPRDADPAEQARADRRQRDLRADGGRAQRRRRRRPGDARHARASRRGRSRGAAGTSRDAAVTIASVAPNDSTKPGSSTVSGAAIAATAAATRQGVERGAAMIDRARRRGRRRPRAWRAAPTARGRRRIRRTPGAAIDPAAVARGGQPRGAAGEHEQRGEQRDVAARDRDDVIGARLLQPALVLGVEPAAIADQNRRHHAGGPRAPPADGAARRRADPRAQRRRPLRWSALAARRSR